MSETLMRQWQMLKMIPRHPSKVSPDELVHRLAESGFNVYARKIQRDLVFLSELFPIDCDKRNKPYGWYWSTDVHAMDVPGMGSHTALAFFLAEQHLAPLLPNSTSRQLQPHFKTAAKVLDSTHSGKAGWRDKVRVLHSGPDLQTPAIDPDVQYQVYDALLHNRKLQIQYVPKQEQDPKQYEINPLGLVFKDSMSYLVCSMWDYADIRLLTLHRMIAAKALDIPASSPEGFDLDSYIASGELHFAVGGDIKLKALISSNLAFHLGERPISDDQVIESQEDDIMLLHATVQDTNELHWWLLAFGDQVEVLEPVELREQFAEIASNMNDRYNSPE